MCGVTLLGSNHLLIAPITSAESSSKIDHARASVIAPNTSPALILCPTPTVAYPRGGWPCRSR